MIIYLFILAFFVLMGYAIWQIIVFLFPAVLQITLLQAFPVVEVIIGALIFLAIVVIISDKQYKF